MKLRTGVALITATVVTVAAGCGGDDRLSKREYEQRVRSNYAEVQQAFLQTRGATARDLPGLIARAQAEVSEAAGDIDADPPPEEIEGEHEQLVEGLREYAEILGELRRDAAAGDPADVVAEFNAGISDIEAVEEIAEAAEAMKFKGYNLGPIAEE
jgi:hypothetical protein